MGGSGSGSGSVGDGGCGTIVASTVHNHTHASRFAAVAGRMGVYALLIVNRAGGLIYHQRYVGAPRYSLNDFLRLASTFHGLQQLSKEVAPVAESALSFGIETLEVSSFRLRSYQPPTGIKFVVLSTPEHDAELLSSFLREVYRLYADYALKNPFYEHDMPIRCKLFDAHLASFVSSYIDE